MIVTRLAWVLLAIALSAADARAQTALHVAASEDLRALDPTWTTADATQNFSYLVYETLFSLDQELNPKPQMMENDSVSADGLQYDFLLRPDLAFHDGSPVTSNDVVASFKRWSIRAVDGSLPAQRVDAFVVTDARRFTIKLKQPFSMVLTSLGNPASTTPIIMRAADAQSDPNQPVRTGVGSGPFVFEPDKWVPGSSWRSHRNAAYFARKEPPSGMAGGRIAHVDAVQFSYIPDPTTALNALRTGQIDIQQVVPYDLIPLLKQDGAIEVKVVVPFGFQALIRPNSLVPPFNNAKARRALLYFASPSDYLTAMVSDDPSLQKACLSSFMCGPGEPQPFGTMEQNREQAKQLMQQAGCHGETVVVLAATDLPELYQLSTILSQRLGEIGVKIEQQNMDFATVAT